MTDTPDPGAPRSLGDSEIRRRRKALLWLPHVAPLTRYVRDLRLREGLGYIPDFDPLDGGINARILFLFEKPGRATFPPIGSGFISRNNNDPTAEATNRFMNEAGIDREDTVLWNTIPGWDGTRDFDDGQRNQGLACLPELLDDLLKRVRVIVLCGTTAERARKVLPPESSGPDGYTIFPCMHPSPINRAARFEEWSRIPRVWEEAAGVALS
jgi:uracil-DNA glycosylase